MKYTAQSMYKHKSALTTFVAIAALLVLSSCTKYNVQGLSSITAFDGSKLYLKKIINNELKTIDSCDVVHGKFDFSGELDTTHFVTLFMGEESIMPIILEDGDIKIKIDNTGKRVSGTPLNDILYEFLDQINQLNNKRYELSHKHTQLLLDGIEEYEANRQINIEAARISEEEDRLIMKYVSDNFDNIVGPVIFMMLTNSLEYPILTPQIEHIMSMASEKFKSHPYVTDYYSTAQENEARMQGLSPEQIDTLATDSISDVR